MRGIFLSRIWSRALRDRVGKGTASAGLRYAPELDKEAYCRFKVLYEDAGQREEHHGVVSASRCCYDLGSRDTAKRCSPYSMNAFFTISIGLKLESLRSRCRTSECPQVQLAPRGRLRDLHGFPRKPDSHDCLASTVVISRTRSGVDCCCLEPSTLKTIFVQYTASRCLSIS